MNTTKVGDAFEKRSYDAMRIAINEGLLGVAPDSARVFCKKGYFSTKRNKEIVVDISIEIWPPNASRPSIIYLIECKDYSKKGVPVNDVEEFHTKVLTIADGAINIKPVFITSSYFQSGALELGKNFGFMMIELDKNNDLSIKFHKKERDSNSNAAFIDIDKKLEKFFQKVFDLNQNNNIPVLSKINIAKCADKILIDFDPKILLAGKKISIEKLIAYFETTYGLSFNLGVSFPATETELLGYYDLKANEIQINQKLNQTYRQAFVIAHEIGHYILHKELRVTQEYYDSFSDSEYDFRANKHMLTNFRHWIEWQANYFAACLLMPKDSFRVNLIKYHLKEGIRNTGTIYLDDQRVNQKDFQNILIYLSEYFSTTKMSVIYRLQEFNLITYANNYNSYQNELRNVALRLDEDYERESTFNASARDNYF